MRKSQNFPLWFLKCLVILVLPFLFTNCINSDDDISTDINERVRKNAKDLSSEEKADYVNAILKLKATHSPYSDTLSYYDQFVRFHQMAVEQKLCSGIGVAHANPAFPPWHRKLLILYEDALSEVSGKKIALPYWDWTDPASTAATFSDELMGGNGNPDDEYAVTDGPFRKNVWQVNLLTIRADYIALNPHPWLVRNFGATLPISQYPAYPGYEVRLPTIGDISRCLDLPVYDAAPWDCNTNMTGMNSFRVCLEGFTQGTCSGQQAIHNIGHDWIAGFFKIPVDSFQMLIRETVNPTCGTVMRDTVPNNIRIGSMEPLDVSPNDPAFFMHHCNVDRLWDVWQQIPGNASKYQPDATSGAPDGYKVDDEMYPYKIFKGIGGMNNHGITPRSMLSVEDLGYRYE